MSSPKPVFVLIPGAWHTPEGFTPLMTLLSIAGYPCIPISIPSASAHPGHPDFSQDVKLVRNTISSLVEAGKEVVVVMHSGGSIPGSQALPHLSKSEREKEGKKGGVIRLVYIGILLPKAGKTMYETFYEVMQSPDLDPEFVRDENEDFHVAAEDGTSTITDGETRFYNDLPPEQAKYWASRMTSSSLGALMSPLTYQAWNHIPSAYILGLKDKSIPLKQVREIVKRANIEMVLEVDSGHCPYLNQPEMVVKFIRKAAGEVV